jgi:magnesium-transporting ATPase (P-type)
MTSEEMYMIKYLAEQSHRMKKGLKKYLQFKISSNFTVMLVMLLGSCIFFEIMLAPVQIIWICCIISEFAERALISEMPEKLYNTKPCNRSSALISKNMWKNIFLWTFMMTFIFLCIVGYSGEYFNLAYVDEYFGHYVSYSWLKKHEEYEGILKIGKPALKLRILSLAFLSLVTMQLATILNSRIVDAKQGYVSAFTDLKKNFLVLVTLFGLLMFTIFTFTMGGRFWHLVELKKPVEMGLLILNCMVWMVIWGMLVNFIPGKWFECIVYKKHGVLDKRSTVQKEIELSNISLA